MLYQFLVGDFRKPLTAGWEADVADPLLREDIALAAAGEPERRLKSAADLAERLRNLDRRRAETAAAAAPRRSARVQAERRLERARARRPWIVAGRLRAGHRCDRQRGARACRPLASAIAPSIRARSPSP